MKTVVLIFTLVASLIGGVIILIRCLIMCYQKFAKGDLNSIKLKTLRATKLTLLLIIITFMGVLFSQAMSHTPDITGEGAISELISIPVNGRKEWISIRGKDQNKPILLFLAGGPGGSQLASVRRNLSRLEEDFVIVNWEQPGAGKSYDAILKENLTVDTYVQDGIEVTKYLRNRFQRDKIYLIGESWGSLLGIFMANEKPDYYYAFIGTGQMVDFGETELRCYQQAIEKAKENKDLKMVEQLEKMGPPPYASNIALKAGSYLQYLSQEMTRNPKIHNPGYDTIKDITSEEYGFIDQLNYVRGMLTTFSDMYLQLWDTDLRQGYTQIEIPVYFLVGRHDLNAPGDLTEDYFQRLSAPDKQLIWYEHSGHSPWINEYKKFCEDTRQLFVHHKE